MSKRQSKIQPWILSALDPFSEVPLKLHDRCHRDMLGPEMVAYLDRDPLPRGSDKSWALWWEDVDLVTDLIGHLGKSVVRALRAYKIGRMTFADAARACGKTMNSLKGFAGIATRLAQKFCRAVAKPHERPLADNPFIAYYGE